MDPLKILNNVIGHLMKGYNRNSAKKTVFFFLRADVTNSVKVAINGKAVNRGKGWEWEFHLQ